MTRSGATKTSQREKLRLAATADVSLWSAVKAPEGEKDKMWRSPCRRSQSSTRLPLADYILAVVVMNYGVAACSGAHVQLRPGELTRLQLQWVAQ